MKSILSIIITFCLAAVMLLTVGCEYDVTKPGWEQDHNDPEAPQITAMVPDNSAPAGFNTLQIMGENFSAADGGNTVYFDNIKADVLDFSSTSLTVRRPNIVSDSVTVKVSSADAIVVAKYGPYKIEQVFTPFGEFIENQQLNAVTADKAGNIYVCQYSPRTIYKITPDGQKTVLGESSRTVLDAKVSPDGKLLLMVNYSRMYAMDTETGEETEWLRTSKKVSYGDFDENGYFYGGGRRSDLVIIAPDQSIELAGVYASDEIFDVRVFDGYVYLIATAAEPVLGIWRHKIGDNGAVGEGELVIDWAQTGEFAESTPNSLTFAADGTMYVATTHENPILMIKPDYVNGDQDIMYKGILPTTIESMHWGNGTELFVLTGGENFNMYSIDMGQAGAPYYGIE